MVGVTRAESPNTPEGYVLGALVAVGVLTVSISWLRDPNSRLSRRFIRGWPTPLLPWQATLCRVIGAVGTLMTGAGVILLIIELLRQI